jgi:AraC family transcriptional regulator of adaptative response/methylated-DNA-[protein]-cysteine methyltransferase
VVFFASAREALLAGFRPCRRCRPLEPRGARPTWLAPLLAEVERDPSRRWRDADLRARGLAPGRVRRWFVAHHRLTFQAYSRARRLAAALGSIRDGSDVTNAAFASGYESLSGFHEAFRNVLGRSPTRMKDAPVLAVERIPTPLGPMVAAAGERALLLLEFADRRMLETQLRGLGRRLRCAFVPGTNDVLRRTAAELKEYFAGERRAFDVPLETPRCARSAARSATTGSRSFSPATAWWEPAGASPATAAASGASGACSSSSAARRVLGRGRGNPAPRPPGAHRVCAPSGHNPCCTIGLRSPTPVHCT